MGLTGSEWAAGAYNPAKIMRHIEAETIYGTDESLQVLQVTFI